MQVVIDASVAAAWCLRDENVPQADGVIERLVRGTVPTIFWDEMRNILINAERKKRINFNEIEICFNELRETPIETDYRQDGMNILRLARQHKLSAYDAAYLEVAKRQNIGLATLDKKLAKAAAAEHIAYLI